MSAEFGGSCYLGSGPRMATVDYTWRLLTNPRKQGLSVWVLGRFFRVRHHATGPNLFLNQLQFWVHIMTTCWWLLHTSHWILSSGKFRCANPHGDERLNLRPFTSHSPPVFKCFNFPHIFPWWNLHNWPILGGFIILQVGKTLVNLAGKSPIPAAIETSVWPTIILPHMQPVRDLFKRQFGLIPPVPKKK